MDSPKRGSMIRGPSSGRWRHLRPRPRSLISRTFLMQSEWRALWSMRSTSCDTQDRQQLCANVGSRGIAAETAAISYSRTNTERSGERTSWCYHPRHLNGIKAAGQANGVVDHCEGLEAVH